MSMKNILCVCACVRACVLACVRACVREYVRACVCNYALVNHGRIRFAWCLTDPVDE